MQILELLIELLNSFTFPISNTIEWIINDFFKEFPKNLKAETTSDILVCAKAHEQIKKWDDKKISYFVKYKEYVNEENSKKTTAGQINVLFFDKVKVCVITKI